MAALQFIISRLRYDKIYLVVSLSNILAMLKIGTFFTEKPELILGSHNLKNLDHTR